MTEARVIKQRPKLVLVSVITIFAISVSAQWPTHPQLVERLVLPEGTPLDRLVIDGILPPSTKEAAVAVPFHAKASGINVLESVPAFDWSYGCSATSAAMMAGYYDRTGYPNMYSGPANGGLCPLDNSIWGYGECTLSATHQGYDGRATRGHVDDYWVSSYSGDPDPYIGSWAEHNYGDCTADFMKTNQSAYGNIDGGTRFYNYPDGTPYSGPGYSDDDGGYGLALFFESRGYTVETHFNRYVDEQATGSGFTYEMFQQEIDAGRPVLIHTKNLSGNGHTMLAFGYNTSGSLIYIHDTWDYSDHQMAWDGTYSGYQLFLYAVTVIRLADNSSVFSDGFESHDMTRWSAFAP